MTYEQAQDQLAAHGQLHILSFWSELDTTAQENLLKAIHSLDLQTLDRWIEIYVKGGESPNIPTKFDPAPAYGATPNTCDQRVKYDQALAVGKAAISAGQVGAFVVAGGQGTRLGFDGPKGNFPASPIKGKTLFRLFAESILAVSQRYQASCPWYIMTSPLNHQQTLEIFQTSHYFGLPEQDVVIFQQGTLPNFSFDGHILMADQGHLALAPDGHGGSLKALHDSGASKDMQKRGVEYLSYWQVDNPLINIFDPLFLGLHILDQAEMSSKAVRKADPLEKVGNFCLVEGKVTVVEYSDLSDEMACKRQESGNLLFELASIGIHVINRSFVEKLNEGGFSLPIHRAVKKIPHLLPSGEPYSPTEPNGVKLETFVFDALPLASQSIILETVRSEEFGPIKNATGVDSAESSRQMMIDRAARWLETADVSIPRTKTGEVACILEIAPSFAMGPEDIRAKREHIPELKAGQTYYFE